MKTKISAKILICCLVIFIVLSSFSGCQNKQATNDKTNTNEYDRLSETYGECSLALWSRSPEAEPWATDLGIVLGLSYGKRFHDEETLNQVKNALNSATYEFSDYYPMNAEVCVFKFWDYGLTAEERKNSTHTLYLMYDYETEQLYACYLLNVLRVTNTSELEEFLVDFYGMKERNVSGKIAFDSDAWYVDHIQLSSGELIFDRNEAGEKVPKTYGWFRYQEFLLAYTTDKYTRFDGFVNVAPIEITENTTTQEIAERANLEIGYTNYKAHVFYDRLTDYWLVLLYDLDQHGNDWTCWKEVVLDNQGITLEICDNSNYLYEGAYTPEDVDEEIEYWKFVYESQS